MGKIITKFRRMNYLFPKGTEWGNIDYATWCGYIAERMTEEVKGFKYRVVEKKMRINNILCPVCAVSKQKK